jgi:hypothetical protein
LSRYIVCIVLGSDVTATSETVTIEYNVHDLRPQFAWTQNTLARCGWHRTGSVALLSIPSLSLYDSIKYPPLPLLRGRYQGRCHQMQALPRGSSKDIRLTRAVITFLDD